jgi:hypothetical protein
MSLGSNPNFSTEGNTKRKEEKNMNKLPDEISITWHIDDVKSLDNKLTDDQAREVLQLVKNNHDATIGVNWDNIQFHIDGLKNGY